MTDTKLLIVNQNELKDNNSKLIEDYKSSINSIDNAIKGYEDGIVHYKEEQILLQGKIALLEASNKAIDETIIILENTESKI